MEKFALAFVLIGLLKLTQQSRSECTSFGPANPRRTDLGATAWEVKKLQSKINIPVLADYSDVPDSQAAIDRDYSRLQDGTYNPDAELNIGQLVQKYGYSFEEYDDVKTEDGYYLTLHRIPNPGNTVVFINHGLFGSSIDWLMAGRDSLPFLLASLEYDVWLGNFRGNKYSNTHESLNSECAEYWDFSYDDIGYYDLPASVDYITYMTGQSQIKYIGYSLSTTAFFVMTSLRPSCNNKISSMIAVAPMAWSANLKSPILKLFAANEDMERKLKNGLGHYAFRPSHSLTDTLRKVICAENVVSDIICDQIPFLITGFSVKLLNMENFYAIIQNYPAGASIKTLIHYSQNVVSGQFRRFDYPDGATNVKLYDYVNPPNYPLKNIDVKVSFVVSYNDYLSNVTDVAKLIDELPNVGDVVYVDGYSNVDYLWATNVKSEVYDKIVALL